MPNVNNGVLDGVRRIGAKVRDLVVDGVPGATAGFRLRGATQSGPPTAGTWKPGDEIRDRTGQIFVYTGTGSMNGWTAATAGLYPAAGTPRIPRTILTQFQSGHGYTASNAGSSNLNDTTTGNFICGTQAVTITTAGDGSTIANLTNTSVGSFSTAGQYLLVRFRLSSDVNTQALELFLGNDSGFANAYWWQFFDKSDALGAGYAYDNEWEQITLSFSDAQTVGSPTRTGITAVRLRCRDFGSPLTVQWQEVSLVADPGAVFPNGVATICFDDSYVSQYTLARPVLDAYGFRGTLHVIRDQIGGSASLSLAQLQSLQDDLGWEVGCHADTTAIHQASDQDSALAAVEMDFRNEKLWLLQNEFRGGNVLAYPLGQWNPSVLALARKYYAAARTVFFGTQETFPPGNPHKLRALSGISSYAGANPVSTATAAITAAAANRSWLILVFHQIVTTSPASATQILQSDLQTVIAALAASGMPVRTMGEVMRMLAPDPETILENASPALDTVASDIQPAGTAASAGSVGKPSDAGHIHPAPAGMWLPADSGWVSWNFDPLLIGAGTAPAAGTLYLTRVNVRAAATATNVILYCEAAGTSLTTNQNFAGLYNSSGTLIAATADQTTNWETGSNFKTMALSGGPYSLSAGFYWVAILYNGSGTAPTFGRLNNNQAAQAQAGVSAANYRWATNGTGTSLSGITPSSNVSSPIEFWAGIS
jgi:peptidoglycan/xylan/chitin deacetylase (PgdA/CDA1 family)